MSNNCNFVEIANSTTKAVATRIPVSGGPYEALSVELNGWNNVSELNGLSSDARFHNHNASNPKKGDQEMKSIFSVLKPSATGTNPKYNLGVINNNLVPALHQNDEDLGMLSNPITKPKPTSHIPTAQKEAARKPRKIQKSPQGRADATSVFESNLRKQLAAQPQSSGAEPLVDDYYVWHLGDEIDNLLKGLASDDPTSLPAPQPDAASTKAVTDKPKVGEKPTSKKALFTSSTSPSPNRTKSWRPPSPKDKTVFTSPSPTPSVINGDYFRRTSGTPDSRGNPITPATTAPSSPTFTDAGGGGGARPWSFSAGGVKREWSPTAPPLSPVASEASREYTPATSASSRARSANAPVTGDRYARYSPATDPPLSPITDAGSVWSKSTDASSIRSRSEVSVPEDHARDYSPVTEPPPSPADTDGANGRAWSEDAPTMRGRTSRRGELRGLFDDDEETSPEDLFSTDVVAEPSARVSEPRVITRRPIRELKALIPRGKKATAKRRYTKRKQEVPAPKSKVRVAAPPPVSVVPTFKQISSTGAVKRTRPASPSRPPYAGPSKRQATQANAVRRPKPVNPSMLINWSNELLRFEELIFQGKQGPGEVKQVVGLLNAMIQGAQGTPLKWLEETERTRVMGKKEERQDKLQLLREVAIGYRAHDQDGYVVKLAGELFRKWKPLANKLLCFPVPKFRTSRSVLRRLS
ncbi:hypothetical protein DFH07DRAFT_800739 [Mycena maculata]|uniref:Uncharacterized protein n=1 Tax=Mycena maculata TaxID=230809 RepID=A0AAD7NST7_9AGAR|nr:hypothetical protein DFH07DRAFT_800739 [Mycena maculata]